MHVVTIAAPHQPFVHAMVVRPREVSLGGNVATVAKIRRLLRQQMLRLRCMMRRMAVQASHVAAGMGRCRKVSLLVTLSVASQAAAARLLPRHVFKADDLADIAAAFHVRRAGPVARLAAMSILQRRLEMRGLLKVFLIEILVTCLADIYANICWGRLVGRYRVALLANGTACLKT